MEEETAAPTHMSMEFIVQFFTIPYFILFFDVCFCVLVTLNEALPIIILTKHCLLTCQTCVHGHVLLSSSVIPLASDFTLVLRLSIFSLKG